jgi:ComF family protein
LRRILDLLLALLYPPACPLCGRETRPASSPRLCRACAASLERAGTGCPRCGEPGPERECGRCLLDPPPFRAARSALVYRDRSPVARAIQRWKYDRDEVVGAALAVLFREGLAAADAAAYDRIVPVPGDPRRLRSRGFNPALVLARAIAPRSGQLAPGSLRRRAGGSQVGRGEVERRLNAGASFAIAPRARVRGASVLLVDDVYTTGATARGCAAALASAGAAVVDVWTLAHTAPPDSGAPSRSAGRGG